VKYACWCAQLQTHATESVEPANGNMPPLHQDLVGAGAVAALVVDVEVVGAVLVATVVGPGLRAALLDAVELICAQGVLRLVLACPHLLGPAKRHVRARGRWRVGGRAKSQPGEIGYHEGLQPHRAAADDAEVDLHDGPHPQHRLLVGHVGDVPEDEGVRQSGYGADDDAVSRSSVSRSYSI
jgi:hypothetical protein